MLTLLHLAAAAARVSSHDYLVSLGHRCLAWDAERKVVPPSRPTCPNGDSNDAQGRDFLGPTLSDANCPSDSDGHDREDA